MDQTRELVPRSGTKHHAFIELMAAGDVNPKVLSGFPIPEN